MSNLFQIRVDASELAAAGKRIGGMEPAMQAEIVAAVAQTEAVVLVSARTGAPVFMGMLVNSIQATGPQTVASATGFVVTDIVQTTSPYAFVQEDGRRAGAAPPPFTPIRRWVELKVKRGDMDLDDPGVIKHARAKKGTDSRSRFDRSIDSLAWRIRASIGRKGYPGKHFMARSVAVGQTFLEKALAAVVERWPGRF